MYKYFSILLVLLLGVCSTVWAEEHDGPRGAFHQLSPGNQKIVKAIFKGQVRDDGADFFTRNEIAQRKLNGEGFGNIVKDLQQQGRIEHRNLGQLIKHSKQHGYRQHRQVRDGVGRTHDASWRPGRASKQERVDGQSFRQAKQDRTPHHAGRGLNRATSVSNTHYKPSRGKHSRHK